MKKIMNKLAKTAVLCVFVFSCADLNKQPNGVETDNTFFKNEDQAKRAITSVYDVTAWYNTQEMDEWVFGDICSDDAEKGGEGPADAPQMEKMKYFNCDPNVPYTKDMWNETYEGIFRANQCIDNIPTISMDATLRAQYVGEAKFLRALYYFRLQRTFNGVPLILHPLTRDQYCQKRASPAEVWAQMEQDLKDAAGALPEKKAYSSSDLGRATKGAANALLTKAYIFQKKWSDAKTTAETVVNSGQYDLEPNYADIFTLAHKNGIESIYEFQHLRIATGEWGDANEGTITSIYCRGRSYSSNSAPGWGYVCPTDGLDNEFEPNDPRKKCTIIENGDSIWQGTPWAQVANNAPSPTGRMGRKILVEYMPELHEMSNGPQNWIFMRYADLLLWHAEACCQLGESAPALASLNKVRQRAKMPDVTATDKDALLKAIYHERRVELALEGHRYWDIIRTDRGAECLGANGYTENKKYFPLPQSQIDVCPLLEQNPYYQ